MLSYIIERINLIFNSYIITITLIITNAIFTNLQRVLNPEYKWILRRITTDLNHVSMGRLNNRK